MPYCASPGVHIDKLLSGFDNLHRQEKDFNDMGPAKAATPRVGATIFPDRSGLQEFFESRTIGQRALSSFLAFLVIRTKSEQGNPGAVHL
jgi:hypothetical protein